MIDDVLAEVKDRMDKTIESFRSIRNRDSICVSIGDELPGSVCPFLSHDSKAN